MSNLRISLFGGVRIENGTIQTQSKITSTISNLLAYLILNRQRAHPRDVLANLLWSDYPQERARACLNTAVWRLRKVLEPDGIPTGTYLLSTSMGELSFNCQGDVWVDVAEFEKNIQRCSHKSPEEIAQDDINALESAVGLYAGDLLEGCYCDWALRERERMRQFFIDALYYLLRFYQFHNKNQDALAWGQKILMLDPLREDVHRQMMRLYLDNGQRSLAMRQYQQCRKVLAAEMGIEPMPETQMLYDRSRLSISSPRLQDERSETLQVHDAILRLQNAVETVNKAQKDLQRALDHLN